MRLSARALHWLAQDADDGCSAIGLAKLGAGAAIVLAVGIANGAYLFVRRGLTWPAAARVHR